MLLHVLPNWKFVFEKKKTQKKSITQSSLKVLVRFSTAVSAGRDTIKLPAIKFIMTSPLSAVFFHLFCSPWYPKGCFWGCVADKCSVMSLTHISYYTSGTMCTVDTVSSCCGLWHDYQHEQKQEKKPSHILLRAEVQRQCDNFGHQQSPLWITDLAIKLKRKRKKEHTPWFCV